MNPEYKNSYKNTQKELVSLSVYNTGFQKCEPRHQWGPGIRDHYLIHHIITGKGFYQANGKTYEINAGDTFLVYPQTEVSYYADGKNPWEYAWVGFQGSDAAIILKATDFSPSSPVLPTSGLNHAIQAHLMGIYEARGSGFVDSVEMTGRLYRTLALFMKHSSTAEHTNTASNYVQTAIAYISANYSYPLTIEDIASYVGISRSHLFRSFEAVLQKSPKEYLTAFRLKQACYLLKHSSLSIAALASSVGFDNGLYFSKIFHKEMGIAPREYRQGNSP